VNQFDEEPNETHDGKSNAGGKCNLAELYEQKKNHKHKISHDMALLKFRKT
jgi:hypothetical protein